MPKTDFNRDDLVRFYTEYNKKCPVVFHSSSYHSYYDIFEKKLLRDAISRYYIKIRKAGWALDLGCGSGRYLNVLADFGLRSIGADIAFESLLDLKDKTPYLICLDAHHLAFKEDAFSVMISMFGVLSHCPDIEDVIRETRRVLKSGGICLISVCSWRMLYSLLNVKELVHKFKKYFIQKQQRKDTECLAFDGNIYTRTFWSKNMSRILKSGGLEVLEIRGVFILSNLFNPEWSKKFPKVSNIFYKIVFPIDYYILSHLPLIKELSSFLFFVIKK
jgi:ubiquinone/menaquinone biosynthesis C-methylase UbiE